jgi:phosphohistidine phosphatase
MGEWMKAQGLAPDLIISSPAKRARQTARRICKSLDYEAKQIQWEDSIYDANARAVLKLLTEVPEGVETLLLVGHHLALESMILRMSRWADIPADPKLIPTCAIAWLEFDDDWSNIKKCSAKLQSITRPRVLAEEGSRLSA